MDPLRSVSKPRESPLASVEPAPSRAQILAGSAGTLAGERSRSLDLLVARGRGDSLLSPLETVIGADERQRILDTELSPWNMICALRLYGPDGGGAVGTGWLIGPRTILTAGHCVFSRAFFGGWANRIEIIPGMNGTERPFGSFVSDRLSSVDRWVQGEEEDFDFGCIHLDEPIGEKIGWFGLGVFAAEELENYLVNVSGYPSDRGGSEQFHSRNRIVRVSERRIFYEVDTVGGQSGAPVWIHQSEDGPPIAVGIHAYGIGGTPGAWGIKANSAPRIIPEVLAQLREWAETDPADPHH